MRLSTVICNYNTQAELRRVLASLEATSRDFPHEIIVVDNASRDGSAAMVRAEFPHITLIESSTNLWYSGGNNLGMRAAQGDYVLILNPDTVIVSSLSAVVAYLDAHPDVGALTAQERFPDGTVQRTCSRFNTLADLLLAYTPIGLVLPGWRKRRQRAMWYEDWDRTSTRAVDVAPGSFLVVRRSILEQIDHFDTRLKLFFTDDDLCRRIMATGAAVHYLADYWLYHDEHASLNKVPTTTRRVYFEDMLVYTRLYHGAWAARLLTALVMPTRAGMALKQRFQIRKAANS